LVILHFLRFQSLLCNKANFLKYGEQKQTHPQTQFTNTRRNYGFTAARTAVPMTDSMRLTALVPLLS
jgi:hypothetical protein